MRSTLYLLLVLLATGPAACQTAPQPSLEARLPAYFHALSQELTRLGQTTDSTGLARVQADLLATYFESDSVRVPDWLRSESHRYERPDSLPIRDFALKAPSAYWRGFDYAFDTTRIRLLHSTRQDSLLLATVELPASIRGILLPDRQPQRISEMVRVGLVVPLHSDSLGAIRISWISGSGHSLYGDPLTKKAVHQLENQLLASARLFLSPATPDSIRREACAGLRKMGVGDTLFFRTADKVLVPFSINPCKPPDSSLVTNTKTLAIEEFSLDYLRDMNQDENGMYMGQLIRIAGLRPPITDEKWRAASRPRPTTVPRETATNHTHVQKIANLIIHN